MNTIEITEQLNAQAAFHHEQLRLISAARVAAARLAEAQADLEAALARLAEPVAAVQPVVEPEPVALEVAAPEPLVVAAQPEPETTSGYTMPPRPSFTVTKAANKPSKAAAQHTSRVSHAEGIRARVARDWQPNVPRIFGVSAVDTDNDEMEAARRVVEEMTDPRLLQVV